MHLELCDSRALLALAQASPRAGLCAQPQPRLTTENDRILWFYNKHKQKNIHTLLLKIQPLKLNTKIGNTNRNICSWLFNYHILGCWQKALMSNTCTHNERQTKLFANTNLHLKEAKAVAEQLNYELFSILFLNIYGEINVLSQWSKNFKTATNITKIWLKKSSRFFPGKGEFFPFLKEKLENIRATERKPYSMSHKTIVCKPPPTLWTFRPW